MVLFKSNSFYDYDNRIYNRSSLYKMYLWADPTNITKSNLLKTFKLNGEFSGYWNPEMFLRTFKEVTLLEQLEALDIVMRNTNRIKTFLTEKLE